MNRYLNICLPVGNRWRMTVGLDCLRRLGNISKAEGTKQMEEEEQIDILADFQERMTQS